MNDVSNQKQNVEQVTRAYDLLRTDPSKGIRELEALADGGSSMSMMCLGSAYRNGLGVDANLEQAEFWFSQAAQQGNVRARYEMGRVCFASRRYAKALEAFQEGCAADYLPAISMLGYMYAKGVGVERDEARAIVFFERAVGRGHMLAKRGLGDLLLRGNHGIASKIRGIGLILSAFAGVRLAFRNPQDDRIG